MSHRSVSVRVSSPLAIAATLWMTVLTVTHVAAQPALQVKGPTDSVSPSSFFYTIYEQSGKSISWLTCGYDTQSSGCYGNGSLGPFGRTCSVAGSSTRVIVADSNPSSGRTTLYFYRQEESSTPSATLQKTLELPDIPASRTARCELSLLGNYLYFGTNESPTFYQVNLKTYTIATGSGCGGNTSAITSNNDFVVVSLSGCFTGFDKQGNPMITGGEFTDTFVPGTNGFNPSAKSFP
jgi:hypothetical protein